ncbi:MAG: hypothetical protein R2705_18575 [Ilumatobacteraceae bacterium]
MPQRYLPESLGDRRYYEPTEHGFEQEITIRMKRNLQHDGQAGDQTHDPAGDASGRGGDHRMDHGPDGVEP